MLILVNKIRLMYTFNLLNAPQMACFSLVSISYTNERVIRDVLKI
jgi:hypothetical protein